MCQNSKIIASVKNGELSVCKTCRIYTLLYNNLCFQFDKNQLLQFRDYISQINADKWLGYYGCNSRKRKIPINTLHQNLILFFSKSEIEDLKYLLTLKDYETFDKIHPAEIDYPLILN